MMAAVARVSLLTLKGIPSHFRAWITVVASGSRVLRKAVKRWIAPLTRQPIGGGSTSIIMSQLIVMMLARPLYNVVSNTTGPGSSR